jgi:hypothetical protein
MAGGAFSRLAQHSRTRSAIAGLLSIAFLCALALSVSPQLHAAVHSHAGQPEHTCVATLIAGGQYEHSAPVPVRLEAPVVSANIPIRLAPPGISLFLGRSVFEHAPPFCS